MIARLRLFSPGHSFSPTTAVGLLTVAVLATQSATMQAEPFSTDSAPVAHGVESLQVDQYASGGGDGPWSPDGSEDTLLLYRVGSSSFVQPSADAPLTAPHDDSVQSAQFWAPLPAEGELADDADSEILLAGFGSHAIDRSSYAVPEKSLPGVVQWMIEHHQHSGACWVGRAETILLWRNAPRQRPIVSEYSSIAPAGPAVLDAGSMESTLAGGPRISLIRYDQLGRGLEFSYLRAFNFRSQAATPPSTGAYTLLPEGIFGNTFPPPNPAIDGATTNLGAGIQGMEFNGRTQWTQNISLLAGLRWVEWRESFSLTTSITDPTIGRVDDNYGMNAINSMYGLQIGADGRLMTPFRWLRIDGLVKAGYYYNIAVQNSSIQFGGQPPYADSLRADSTFPSFVGEVGLTGTIPLTNWLDFQLGYMGLWLEGIAQPTNLLSDQSLTQINPPPPSGSISATGGTVLQGVTFGLQGRW